MILKAKESNPSLSRIAESRATKGAGEREDWPTGSDRQPTSTTNGTCKAYGCFPIAANAQSHTGRAPAMQLSGWD